MGRTILYELDDAERLLRQSIEMRREIYGLRHFRVVPPVLNLARVRLYRGEYDLAEIGLEEVKSRIEENFQSAHPWFLRALEIGALVAFERGNVKQGCERSYAALAGKGKFYEEPNVEFVMAILPVIRCEYMKENYEEAAQLVLRAKENAANTVGSESLEYGQILEESATIISRQGEKHQAYSEMLQSYKIYAKVLGTGHPASSRVEAFLQRWRSAPVDLESERIDGGAGAISILGRQPLP